MLRSAKILTFTACALAIWSHTASAASDAVQEGRSVGKACSPKATVCAVLKDGSMKPTDECGAQRESVTRVLQGDCFDPD